MTTMVAPFASRSYVARSGNTYTSDQYGIISNVVGLNDVADLQLVGCIVFIPPVNELLGKLNAANFNITTDQIIPIQTGAPFRIRRIVVTNTTVNGMSVA